VTDPEEIPLPGGDVTVGVVRVGDTVRRVPVTTSETPRQVLEHLEAVGFDGAPRYLGVDDRGRQTLAYIDGEVAGRPWPAWTRDESRLRSLGALVRRLDDAMAPLGVPGWALAAQEADPVGIPPSPTLVGHLDITPENVVFVDGVARALIDFDLAAPTTRAEEVVNLLLWWAPWMPPEDREPAVGDDDEARRAGVLVDATVSPTRTARCSSRSRSSWPRDRGTGCDTEPRRVGGGWARMWDVGVGDRIRRREAWLRAEAARLDAAVR
jgi:hypothetical protein